VIDRVISCVIEIFNHFSVKQKSFQLSPLDEISFPPTTYFPAIIQRDDQAIKIKYMICIVCCVDNITKVSLAFHFKVKHLITLHDNNYCYKSFHIFIFIFDR